MASHEARDLGVGFGVVGGGGGFVLVGAQRAYERRLQPSWARG
jgi:hypothetical protein